MFSLFLDRLPAIRGNGRAWLSFFATALVLLVLDWVASFSPLRWPAGFDLVSKLRAALVEGDSVMAANTGVLGLVVFSLYFAACMAMFSITRGGKLVNAVDIGAGQVREVAAEARGVRIAVVEEGGDRVGTAQKFHARWMASIEARTERSDGFARQVLLTLQPEDLTHPGRLKAALQLGVRDLFRPALRQVEWIDSFSTVIAMASLTGTVLAIVVAAGKMTSPETVGLGLQAAMLKSLIGFAVRTGSRAATATLRDEMQRAEDDVVEAFSTVLAYEPRREPAPPEVDTTQDRLVVKDRPGHVTAPHDEGGDR